MTGIYQIKHTESDRCYVGSSVNIDKRWREHRSQLRRNLHHSPYLQRTWNKYGPLSFEFVVLESCSVANLISREQAFIDATHPVFNTALVAGQSPMLGRTHSMETRQILSIKSIGPRPPRTAEHRHNMSIANKGKRPSDACMTAMIAKLKGKKNPAHSAFLKGNQLALGHHYVATDETKAKISLAVLNNTTREQRQTAGRKAAAARWGK
jgi:group I intron endonuclease